MPILHFAILPFGTIAQGQQTGTWLDLAVVQWPEASLPAPPKDVEKNITPESCKAYQSPLSSDEERAVADAGWMVFTSVRSGDGITVVGGALSSPWQ